MSPEQQLKINKNAATVTGVSASLVVGILTLFFNMLDRQIDSVRDGSKVAFEEVNKRIDRLDQRMEVRDQRRREQVDRLESILIDMSIQIMEVSNGKND